MNDIAVKTYRNVSDGGCTVAATFSEYIDEGMAGAIFERICAKIADRYVAEHYQEIAAKISQDAIATLSMAESAAKIRESLEKEVKGSVREIVKTEVYQRGILGGMRRIR